MGNSCSIHIVALYLLPLSGSIKPTNAFRLCLCAVSVKRHLLGLVQVYVLWQRRYRSTYPSTLYVTLRGVSAALPQEEEEEGGPRSLLPMQEEKGSITVEQMMALQLASKR